MKETIAVVINSFNRLSLLKVCLPNIIEVLRLNNIKGLIVVVDAGSTDGSIAYIQEQKEQNHDIYLKLPNAGENISFSAGCNLGVEEAIKIQSASKYILLFETDNFFKNNTALKQAIELMNSLKCASVGFTIEKFDGYKITFGNNKPSVIGFLLGQTLARNLGIDKSKTKWLKYSDKTYTACDIVFTSPLLIDAQVWQEVNGMDAEKFPFSDSDADLCLSFRKTGRQNVVLLCDGVIHDNHNQASAWSAKRVVDYHIAHHKLILKHKSINKYLLKTFLLTKYSLELGLSYLRFQSSSQKDARKQLIRYHLNLR